MASSGPWSPLPPQWCPWLVVVSRCCHCHLALWESVESFTRNNSHVSPFLFKCLFIFNFWEWMRTCMHVCVHHWVWCLQRPAEGIRSPRTGVTGGCELLCGLWEQSPGPLPDRKFSSPNDYLNFFPNCWQFFFERKIQLLTHPFLCLSLCDILEDRFDSVISRTFNLPCSQETLSQIICHFDCS